jgi:hypothetical protein
VIFQQTAGDDRGHIYSTVTQSFNNKPVLQVVSHYEKSYGFGHMGSIHVFQTFQNGDWQEITAYRHDDILEFSSNSIKIEDENLAYFWLGSKFGVSKDGGKIWEVWDSKKHRLAEESIRYRTIKNVVIDSGSGKGKMFLRLHANLDDILILETEDFGKTWHR